MEQPNWVDRATDWVLGIVAPQRVVARQHIRRMESDEAYRDSVFALMRTRGYRAARMGDRAPWAGLDPRSADAEVLGDLPRMRSRSRELNRDDSIGSGLFHSFTTNTVGTGILPQSQTGNAALDDLLEQVFNSRRDSLSPVEDLCYGGHQQMVFMKALEDGEILVKKTVADMGEPVWFEMIEADRLARPLDARPEDLKGDIRDGVEKDRWGRPVAYWIRKVHPGDFLPVQSTLAAKTGRLSYHKADFDRVPAQFIKHLKLTSRPGQTRGVPLLHAVMQDIRDLDLLMVAALKRSQLAACIAAFIKSTQQTSSLLPVTAETYGFQLDQGIEPGMLFKLFPGEEIQSFNPTAPVPNMEAFIKALAQRIGAALGVCYQIVLKDFQQSNYSSARTDLLESRQTFKILQRWFIDEFLVWQWTAVLEDAMLRGELRGVTPEQLRMVRFVGNGWDWIDPEKEAKAVQLRLEIGLTTLRDEAAALGKDWEDLMRQRLLEQKFEMDMRAELGLDVADEEDDEGAEAKKEDDEERAAFLARDRKLTFDFNMAEREPAQINLTLPEHKPQPINVAVEPVSVNVERQAQVISVEPAPVSVHVEPTPINVDNTINVQPTPVTIENEVNVETPKPKAVKFKRNKKGDIEGAEVAPE